MLLGLPLGCIGVNVAAPLLLHICSEMARLRAFPLPPLVVVHVGRFLDIDSRRSCVLAHRGLRHVMESYLFQKWAVRPSCEFGAKGRALLSYKPDLLYLSLTVDAASEPLTGAQAAELGAFVRRLGARREAAAPEVVVGAAGSCVPSAALSSVLRCVFESAQQARRHPPAGLVCFLSSFSSLLLALEVLADFGGGAFGYVKISVQSVAILVGDDEHRAARLLQGWRAAAAERRWFVDMLEFQPSDLYIADGVDAHELLLLGAEQRETVRGLLGATCRVLSVQIGSRPTLLSDIAHVVCLRQRLSGDGDAARLLEHLAGNAALTQLVTSRVDPSALLRLPQLPRVLRDGVRLVLWQDVMRDPSLGGFVAAVLGTTRAAVELRVEGPDFAQAVAARRALDLVGGGSRARVSCVFSDEAAALGQDRMTLPQLEAALARSAPPWQRLLFGLETPPDAGGGGDS
jgi:hypothetical protein